MRSSNTSHNRRARWLWLFRGLLAGLSALCLVGTARAVDPNRAMSQYIRDRWGTERGFPGGPVHSITQTADGYLWMGTESGLVRFDGLSFRLMRDLGPAPFSTDPVFGVLADSDGNLWVRSWGPMMLRYRDGELKNVRADLGWPYSAITAMYTTKDGALLFSEMDSGAVMYREKGFETLVPAAALPRSPVISMAETPRGDIWMGTRDAGLFRLSGREVSAITKGLPDQKINCLLPDGEADLWIGTDNGVVRWNGTGLVKTDASSSLNNIQALAMTRDRDSNVWIGTNRGLFRLNARGVSTFDERDYRSSGAVTALFEDREGNLWVGTAQGIERLRDGVFMTYSASKGMPSESVGPVRVDSEERAWFAPSDGGLYWLSRDRINRVTEAGLGGDVVYSIAGGKGEVWVGRQRGGLTHLSFKGGSFAARTYTRAEGLAQDSVYAVHQNRDGTVWAGTLSGGASRLTDGKFTTYTTANGLASNSINSILEGSDGTMWFATPAGLSALSNGRWQTHTTRSGLPSDNVNCLFEDSAGTLWVGTSGGISFINSGQVHTPVEAPGVLREQILGIAEDKSGSLWIATSNHVLSVNRDGLLRGEIGEADAREYGPADGLIGVEGVKRHRSVVADPLGRIWFSLNRGISVVDPARLRGSSVPAIAHIQSVSADGTPIDLRSPVRIPASRQRIAFGYAGLSLSVPERVKFRYILDGFDPNWSEPVSTREAIYTNLSPGSYRFRLIASNGNGIWNGAEAVIGFEIEPMFWQTWWFRLSAGLAFVFALLALYRFRLHQLTRQMNVRFEERLAERTRIAQELHDTLLQGFLSASMQLHVATSRLPEDSSARPLLSRVLELMGQVIEEGRNAVQGLRSSNSSDSLDLEQAFSRVRQELTTEEQTGFRVIVEGRSLPLHPVIRDEVYRIGREALVNAFRHSRANNIEVEVEYVTKQLRVLVRDDGCGIDPQVVRSGRDGHWGISGMRERAERIGAKLKVRSRVSSGTEVELSVPGHIAFQARSSDRPSRWLAGFDPRKAGGAKKRKD